MASILASGEPSTYSSARASSMPRSVSKMTRCKDLRGQVIFQRFEKRLHEGNARLRRFRDIAIGHVHHHSHQSGVAPVIANGIGYRVDLSGIFAGNDAIARLIPIENDTLI